MISIRLSGMDKLQAAIKAKDKAFTDGVDKEMTATVLNINRQQKRMAPVDKGLLRSSLNVETGTYLDKTIVSTGPGSSYAPYQEFGTGGLVSVPQGLEEEAAQFKGKGIRQVNIRAHPFFFPPFFAEKPKFIKRIKDLLK